MITDLIILGLLFLLPTGYPGLKDLSVTYRMRGYCYAESSIVDTMAPGGFGGSDNAAKNGKPKFSSITGALFLLDTTERVTFQNFEEPVETNRTKALRLRFERFSERDPQYKLLRDSLIDLLYEKFNGHNLYLINNSDSIIKFAASDSRLDIVAEVKVDTGWAAIEYNPSSWCGNSYHTVLLKQNEYWQFTVPSYSGKIKTKLRYRLKGGSQVMYSNEIACSINKEQLQKKQGHSPNGIMDPYDE